MLMKSSNLLTVLAIVTSVAAGHAQAQSASPSHTPNRDPFVKGPNAAAATSGTLTFQNLIFTVEVYSMAQDDAAQVIELSGSGETRHDAVLALMHAGKARLEALLCCGCKAGQRSIASSTDEVRFASEFSGGTPQYPTAFETRSAGDTMEFEPSLSGDGSRCVMNIVLETVRLTGFPPVFSHKATPIEMPCFQTQRITATHMLDVGQMEFLGTFSRAPQFNLPVGSSQQVRLAFGKIDRIEIGTERIDANLPAGLRKQLQSSGEGTGQINLQPPSVANGAHEKDPTPANVELTLSYYSLDRETAREILSKGFAGDACYVAVKALTDKNQARLERVTVVRGPSGERSAVDEQDEVRYPVEFNLLQSGTGASLVNAGSQPTLTETRNLGLALEMEPAVNSAINAVDLNLVPTLTAYEGDIMEGQQLVPQPLFKTRKITTNILVPIGQHALVGTFSDPGDDGVNGRKDTGRTWLCFVRATL